MRLPGFTAEASRYESTQCYTMASSVVSARDGGLVSIAATLNPFTHMCYPKGCLQCEEPGYQSCHMQNYPDCDWYQKSCDWYGLDTSLLGVIDGGCLYSCTQLHCKGGVCDAAPCDPSTRVCYPDFPDCPAGPLPRC